MTAERIEILKAKARREEIFKKASLIACELGVREPKAHGAWHYYPINPHRGGETRLKHSILQIAYDDYGANMSIHWGEVQVFGTQLGEIIRYRPDIEQWKEELEELWQPLMHQKAIDKAIDEAKKEKELMDRWGIKP